MNSVIKKLGFQIGLVAAVIQVFITIYLYKFGSFLDPKIGVLIIVLNLLFGVTAALLIKKKLNNIISLRESFSGYFITILVSVLISSAFYVAFFKFVATNDKKEAIKKELIDFQIQTISYNKDLALDMQKTMDLIKQSDPFGLATTAQSVVRYLLIYSLLGLLISYLIKNKSSTQEVQNQ